MTIEKVSWRTIHQKPNLKEAIDAAVTTGLPHRTILHPGCEVGLQRPFLVDAPTSSARDFGATLFGRKSFWAAAVEAIVAPNSVFFPEQSILLIAGKGLCEELDYENDYSKYEKFFRKDGSAWKMQPETELKIAQSQNVYGLSLIVHPKWHRNYTHWHVEAITNLYEQSLFSVNYDNICLPAANQFGSQSLSIWTEAKSKAKILTGNAYRFQVLVISTHSLFRTWPHPATLPGLRQFVSKARCRFAPNAQRGPPIYLSRQDSAIRSMSNENELCTALAKIGCRIVVAADHSYEEQIKIFASASGLISPHGSGLTNMIFLPNAAPILELRAMNAQGRSPLWDRSYHTLASVLSRPYGALIFENLPNSDTWDVNVPFVVSHVKSLF